MSSSFTDLLRSAWEASGRTPTLSLYRTCWDVLVGTEMAKHTRPVAIRGNLLRIEARRAWVPEITRRAEELRELMAPRLPFEPPVLEIVGSDDFVALAPSIVTPVNVPHDDRAAELPEGTRELAERILWHIRKESE